MNNRLTNMSYLRHEQYRDNTNLDARIALHQRFSTSREDWFRWLFDRLPIGPEARILEVGCGTAQLWAVNVDRIPPGWEITLTDLSPGMLVAAQAALGGAAQRFQFAEADVQNLPYPDASFDAVIANFMLYHVPDRARAIAELRRVLRPAGTLVAATNGPGHLRELRELAGRYLAAAEPAAALFGGVSGFGLDNGAEQLAAHFTQIQVVRFPDALRVTEAEPLLAYILSTPAAEQLSLEARVALQAEIEETIAQQGAFTIAKEPGMFIVS